MGMTASKFVGTTNPFTGEDLIKVVPIPPVHSKSKGTTAHDAKFEHLLDFKQALQMPEHEFAGVRKALQRFLDNKGIRDTTSVRQFKDYKTKTYTIWLVNEPPKVRIPRKKAT
jgi:hypothetical protein